MKCEKCALTLKAGDKHELAECCGALRYSHAALTDACKRLLAAASESGGYPLANQWKDFHEAVLSFKSGVSVQDIRREIDRVLSRPEKCEYGHDVVADPGAMCQSCEALLIRKIESN